MLQTLQLIFTNKIKVLAYFQYLSISIDVGLEDHLVELVVGEVDVQPGHDELELRARHEPVAVFVEHPECLTKEQNTRTLIDSLKS